MFAPGGTPVVAGDQLVQPDLAGSLDRIALSGVGDLYTGVLWHAYQEGAEAAGHVETELTETETGPTETETGPAETETGQTETTPPATTPATDRPRPALRPRRCHRSASTPRRRG